MIRYTVHFSGRVQGVGFRYTVVRVAGGYCVAGTVENLADGRVRLIAEGDQIDLDRIVAEVESRMAGNIAECLVDRGEPTGEFGEPVSGGISICY